MALESQVPLDSSWKSSLSPFAGVCSRLRLSVIESLIFPRRLVMAVFAVTLELERKSLPPKMPLGERDE